MKKLFLIVVLGFFSFIFLRVSPISIFAQETSSYTNPYSVPNVDPSVKPSLNVWMQSALIGAVSAVSCQLSGLDPATVDHRCLTTNPQTGKLSYVSSNNNGLIGMMALNMGQFYRLPFHTGDYAKYLSDNFGFTQKAYAASCNSNNGVGYCGLQPFLTLWAAFRNISYLFLTIIFLIIGVAIMFRVKIDPRTVMSIENQIPKLIIGLILITFSYAIAGLMIDFMYVLIYVLFNFLNANLPNGVNLASLYPAVFQGNNPITIGNNLFPTWQNFGGGYFGVVNQIASSLSTGILNLLGITSSWNDNTVRTLNSWNNFAGGSLAMGKSILDNLGLSGSGQNNSGFPQFGDIIVNVISFAMAAVGAVNGAQTGNAVTNFFVAGTGSPAIGAIAGGSIFAFTFFFLSEYLLRFLLPYAIAYLIFVVALFLLLFRVWFSLLMAYAYIVLDVILAPLWILAGLIPGSEIKFETWIRDLGANLLTFPITVAMFLFASVLYQVANANTQQLFVPPLVGLPTIAGQSNIIGALLAIAIIFLTPSATQMAKEALKVKENKYGAQAGAGIAAGPTTIGKGIKTYGQSREYDARGERRGLSALLGLLPG